MRFRVLLCCLHREDDHQGDDCEDRGRSMSKDVRGWTLRCGGNGAQTSTDQSCGNDRHSFPRWMYVLLYNNTYSIYVNVRLLKIN